MNTSIKYLLVPGDCSPDLFLYEGDTELCYVVDTLEDAKASQKEDPETGYRIYQLQLSQVA